MKYIKEVLSRLKTNHLNCNPPPVPKTMATSSKNRIRYLSQDEAIALDQELFNEYAFSVDQLMELAGLSVATAIARSYPVAEHNRPVICCGPGNNGGDGLVCARHLKLFGYSPFVICPKPAKNQLYQNLITQCQKYHIDVFIDKLPEESWKMLGVNLIVDAVFGFSFKPPNRNQDLAKLLNMMHEYTSDGHAPIISVDIPSGWHVEKGPRSLQEDQVDLSDECRIPALDPNGLISLTAPKVSAKYFTGTFHYLGGRFCPPALEEKYGLNLPKYPGTDVIVRL